MSATKARTKRRPRRRNAGSLTALQKELWHAVMVAGDLLDDPDAQMRLKACHAVSQAAGAYRALLETTDLEARLETLERELAASKDAPGKWAA